MKMKRIIEYHQVGRMFLLAVLLLSGRLSLFAQDDSNDDPRLHQFMVATTGTYSLTPSEYYQLLHNGYQSDATEKNKALLAAGLKGILMGENPDAESIDSALVRRARQEALRVAERELDVAWLSEGGKITKALNNYHELIMKITVMGGTMDDYERYSMDYEKLTCAVRAVQDAYMDNSHRTREYTRIYEDALASRLDLVSFLRKIAAMKRINKDYEDSRTVAAARSRNTQVYNTVYQRWQDAFVAGSRVIR